MTNLYRAMCAELVELSAPANSLPQLAERLEKLNELAIRARTLLDQPEPEGPTDEELWAAGINDFRANYYPTDALAYARAVLAKWGTNAQ